MSKKKKKIRTTFRKNRSVRTRKKDFTDAIRDEQDESHDDPQDERISGKGDLTRKRTVVGAESSDDEDGFTVVPDIDETVCRRGRVLRVQGLHSDVEDTETGTILRCATRRLLKTLSTDQRHVVAAGDRVWYRPEGDEEGIIERVEPRSQVISRASRGRQHILVTNVDQLLIVASAAEPRIKPNLIDRFLVTAEKSNIRPIICINKIDLVDPAHLMPLAGVYAQLGYQVLMISAETGQGIDDIRLVLKDRQSVVAGQSGVGKSSLLNAIEDDLALRVNTVSADSQKGRHTTTTASLIPLSFGGYVVDTPGIRQFQLWDVIAEEVAGYYRELRPYVSRCRFPDCTHTHETACAVKDAVADGRIDARRYESYVHLHDGDAV